MSGYSFDGSGMGALTVHPYTDPPDSQPHDSLALQTTDFTMPFEKKYTVLPTQQPFSPWASSHVVGMPPLPAAPA